MLLQLIDRIMKKSQSPKINRNSSEKIRKIEKIMKLDLWIDWLIEWLCFRIGSIDFCSSSDFSCRLYDSQP